MLGRISSGINNIYTVLAEGCSYECRIKGKHLYTGRNEYNPLSAGDFVEIDIDLKNPGKAMITARQDRKNAFSRWNRKKGLVQTVAANIDLLVCISSPESPPFRPRFVDRVLCNAEDEYPVLIVMNKTDQGIARSVKKRLDNWKSMGYGLVLTSAANGLGIDELKAEISGKTAAFIGQSGVGKSSILNRIDENFNFKTGSVSEKYNKGTHTTIFAILERWKEGIIIDTPGIKELDPVGIEPETLSYFMRDFKPFLGGCRHSVCLHRDEPGCAVKQAVQEGLIIEERYSSYIRMLSDLEYRINLRGYRKEE